MSPTPFFHGTFTLTRQWAASPTRVFAAWADPELKAGWFGAPPDIWTQTKRSMDFSPGGTEILEGRFKATGAISRFHARYHLIEPNERIVYSYDLYHGDFYHSVTLSSLLVEPEGQGTRIRYTEQIVFLDGKDGTESRRHGTGLQYDLIEKALGLKGGTP